MAFIDTLTNAELKLNCENIFTQNLFHFDAKAMSISRRRHRSAVHRVSGNFVIVPQP